MNMTMNKMKRNIDAGHVFNNPTKMEDMSEYCDITPVDINGGFVGLKGESDILAKTEDNIRDRFNLDTDEGGEQE